MTPQIAPGIEALTVQQTVKQLFSCTFKDLSAKTRKQKFVYIRYCVMTYLDENSVMTNEEISSLFGLNHTAVNHSNTKISEAKQGCNKKLLAYWNRFINSVEI